MPKVHAMTLVCQMFRVASLLLSQHSTQAPPVAVFNRMNRLRSQSHPLAVRPAKQFSVQTAFQRAQCCLLFKMQMVVQRWYQPLPVGIV
jgi:hypothetical protein